MVPHGAKLDDPKRIDCTNLVAGIEGKMLPMNPHPRCATTQRTSLRRELADLSLNGRTPTKSSYATNKGQPLYLELLFSRGRIICDAFRCSISRGANNSSSSR